VTDASGNGAAVETTAGATRFFHRFDRLTAPADANVTVEAVPTGITRVGDAYLVTLTGGCPFPNGVGQVVAIDMARNQRTLFDGLNMPIDVALGPDGALWVLEFASFTPDASCFSGTGYQVKSGRLSRLAPGCLTDDGVRAGCALETLVDQLNFPGAVAPLPDGSLYVSEVFDGRILHITFGDQAAAPAPVAPTPHAEIASAPPLDAADYDAALRAVIEAQGLSPRPGQALKEGATAQAALGRMLFFDPILSGDKNIACATCHHPSFAMADGRVLPIGTGGAGLGPDRVFGDDVTLAHEASNVRRLAVRDPVQQDGVVHNPFIGQFVPRNSPTILNSALLPRQFWDGRVEPYSTAQVKTLESRVNEMGLSDPLITQALFPVTSLHEMAGATLGGLAPHEIRRTLVERLRATPAYVELFAAAFDAGAAEESVTLANMVAALAAFERQLIFTAAPWDAYVAGDAAALTAEQKRGAALFLGLADSQVNCAACHSGDNFTDNEFHNLLAPQLGPGKGNGYSGREDWGRASVTFDARDRYAFRTPSLRNVTLTAPYFHNGAFPSLEAAIWHHADMAGSVAGYDPSANGIPPDLYSSLQPFAPTRQLASAAPQLRAGLPLTQQDVADLVAFLDALTDPAAADLSSLTPAAVPSGLPLDPAPAGARLVAAPDFAAARPAPGAATVETPVDEATVHLRDVAAAVGLDFRHGAFRTAIFQDMVAAMGGGLCWLDYDNDGWLDLYVVNSYAEDEIAFWQANGGLPHNRLFHNMGGRFEDVSESSHAGLAHRGNGCVAADFDNDGWTDLYVTAYGPNALLWNNGDGTFTEGAVPAGVTAPEWSSAAAVADLNGDGRLDLYVGGYIDFKRKIPKPAGAFPQDYYGIPDRLFLNRGPGAAGQVIFEEVTQLAGLVKEERALGAIFTDVDGDGDRDLYIANDGHPNRLYRNDPWPGGLDADPARLGFRFVDVTQPADVGDTGSGMGVASGDYDGDGRFDLFITNWERELNALYRNTTAAGGPITFQYSTFRIGISGLGNGMTGWGTHWIDLDHDTDRDLLIVNGRVPVTNLQSDPELVRYYRNRTWNAAGASDRPGQFVEWTQQVGLKDLGPLLGRGSALGDFDNDGDPDIAINQIAGDLVLLENDGVRGNWLQVGLGGVYPGAVVTVELPDGRQLVSEVHAGSSYLASEDPRLHFGLGAATHAARVRVRWPDGVVATATDVAANQRITLAPPDS
jgi:cytochrome c peroxidase